jgi:coenzyme F420 hydrogenase subunit beta
MQDVPSKGLRPFPTGATASKAIEQHAVSICPGIRLEHTFDPKQPGLIQELIPGWGPVFQVWEGHSTDDEIRFAGSSGGGVSAIALYMLETQDIFGVVHIAARSDEPYRNETVFSQSRAELLSRTGSRYSPASPADAISEIKAAPKPSVFIGKPCDVAAIQKARRLDPELDEKIALTIAFFCAGTPSTNGTLALLKRMGVTDPNQLQSFRYRGNGWPGLATAISHDASGETSAATMTYAESWGDVLTKHVQWRCRLCADHTGEFADIAVGDPWYREPADGDLGSSLFLARSLLGKKILEDAAATNFLAVEKCEPATLPASQPNLLRTRGAMWGRITACFLAGRRRPKYVRLPTFRFWLRLAAREKTSSIFGTLRRLARRG